MKKTISIEGMMCTHCEATVKKALEALPEVTEAVVSHTAGTAVVTLSAPVDDAVLKHTVEAKDYTVTASRKRIRAWQRRPRKGTPLLSFVSGSWQTAAAHARRRASIRPGGKRGARCQRSACSAPSMRLRSMSGFVPRHTWIRCSSRSVSGSPLTRRFAPPSVVTVT